MVADYIPNRTIIVQVHNLSNLTGPYEWFERNFRIETDHGIEWDITGDANVESQASEFVQVSIIGAFHSRRKGMRRMLLLR
jgi:hypothetical protein